VICDDTVEIRAIRFSNTDGALHERTLYVLKYDDDIIGAMSDEEL
jgi:hypothetical protein